MTRDASPSATCLYGSGLLADAAGEPLRPGGDWLSERLILSADFPPGALVVDIGCGGGESLARLAAHGCVALGVDIAVDALAVARHAARVVLARGTALPLGAASVGGVLAECSLSLMASRETAIMEWARVLRPGAVLALGDVFARRPQGGGAKAGITGRETLIREITSAGLEIIRFEDCSEVLKPWVARFVFRYGSLEALWNGACGLSAETARRTAPGYFLMVARKPAGGCDV